MERSLDRSRRRLEDNIKMSLTDVADLLLAWIMLRGKVSVLYNYTDESADTQFIYRLDENCDLMFEPSETLIILNQAETS
jgi:hypothetical protein